MIEIPLRMAARPRWGSHGVAVAPANGLAIPWNVSMDKNGEPLFIVNDSRKHLKALAHNLCPLCGEPHAPGEPRWFVGGPLSAFDKNGWYVDLPGHDECTHYALQACPYLAALHYARERSDQRERRALKKLPAGPPGTRIGLIDETVIPGRPDVFVVVACSDYFIKPNASPGLPYVRPVKPYIAVEFWQHGRRLPDDEGQRIADAALEEWSAERG